MAPAGCGSLSPPTRLRDGQSMNARVVQNHLSGLSRRKGVLEHRMAWRKAAKTWWIYEQGS
jgi:hypothetical protein